MATDEAVESVLEFIGYQLDREQAKQLLAVG